MSKDKNKKDKKSKKDKKDVKSKNGTYKKTGGADKKHDEVRGRESSGRTEVRGGKQQGTLISGVYRGTGKGFAFLTPDDGGEGGNAGIVTAVIIAALTCGAIILVFLTSNKKKPE